MTTSNRKPIVFFLLGSFGVGKTSLVCSRPHNDFNREFSEVYGMLSPGGKRGTDSLNSMGINKLKFYREVLQPYIGRDFLVHGVFYSSKTDFMAFARTHRIVAIELETSEYNNRQRIFQRGGKWNPETYLNSLKSKGKKKEFVRFLGGTHYLIDNNQPFDQVKTRFWEIIDRERP